MGSARQRSLAAAGAVILLGLTASLALAQDDALEDKFRTSDVVTVPSDETLPHDLYAFAGTVNVNGTVEGDLVATAGQINVNGHVTGDVIAAGGTVSVSGAIDGDLRAAGGQLAVEGDVGEDALVAGGQLSVGSDGRIGEDLIFSAGRARLDGAVAGSVQGSAGEYARTGSVGGTEDVTITERAAPATPNPTVEAVADAIRQLVAVVLVGALGLWLFPGIIRESEATVRQRPILALGSGLLTLAGYIVLVVATTILLVLLAIALGGLGFGSLLALDVIGGILFIGVISLVLAFVGAFVADALVGLALGRLVAPSVARDRWRELALLTAGAVVVVILTSLPLIGGLAKLCVAGLGVGALVSVAYSSWRARARPLPGATA